MGRYSRSQIFLDIAYCIFIFLVADSRPLLAGSFFKLIAFMALVCLLAFVVVHSANICKLIISRLQVLSESLFPFAFGRRWSNRPQVTIVIPDEPHLSSLFERPPPFFV